MTIWFPPQEKPQRWGSFQDIQFAVKKNCGKIYKIDPDSLVLALPLFWGLPILDFTGRNPRFNNYNTNYNGKKLIFNGSNSRLLNPSFLDDLVGDFTVGIQFRSEFLSSWRCLIQRAADWYIETNNARLAFRKYPETCIYSTISISTGIDYSAIMTYDGANLRSYINGIANITGERTGLTSSDGDLHVGAWFGSSEWFTGEIIYIYIWNKALTAEQVYLLYERPFSLYQPVSRPFYSILSTPSGVIMPIFSQEGIHTNVFR